MTNIWNWVFSGSAGFIGGLVGGTFKWFVPSWKDLRAERQGRSEQRVNAAIINQLDDGQIWNSLDLATALKLDREQVISGLQRLEGQGRVRSDRGSSDDPGRLYWLNRL